MSTPSRQQLSRGLSRRTMLKRTGVTAIAGLGLFGGQAPARAQQRKLHFLLNSNFRPLFDVEIRKLAAEYAKLSGVEVSTEFITNNDVPARLTAAVESGKGMDLSVVQWNQPHLYENGLVDVSDVVASTGGAKIYEWMRAANQVNGVFRAYPWYFIASGPTYNKTMCDQLGITKFPDTLDEFMAAGKKMKQAGTPIGWCLGHTNGDGAFGNYPIFWSFGAFEVDEKGRVAINSKEARLAIEWMRQFWNDACDPTGMGWNDTSNNQAFLARQIACAYNPLSIYLKARSDAKAARDRGDAKTAAEWDGLADVTRHTLGPAGPAGRYHLNQPVNFAILKHSPNQAAAKEFMRWLVARPQYERCFLAGGGFAQGNTPEWENHALWANDPIIAPFAHIPRYGRNLGFKGPFNRSSAEVQNKYIIADTLARGIQDGADAALKWAEQEMKAIYARA
jgi:multiple sugar transport system substrate-binding protein